MSNQFLDLIEQRRTIYAIGKNVTQSAAELTDLIQNTVKQSPSSFNSQSSRAVILFADAHEKFWAIVADKLKSYAKDAEAAAKTQAKMDSFAAGVGTVLFFEDQPTIENLQQQFPSYAENFPIWSEHSTAIAQFAVWTALHTAGIGASLQHYNPIVDAEVAKTFDIPENWKLRAQLVFGSIEAAAGPKDFMNDAERFKRFE